MKTFVIAEIGVNHNGRIDLALELVERAAEAGASAAKFQSFKADTLVTRTAGTVAYQKAFMGEASQHAMLKRLEFPEEHQYKVMERCRALGIEFMSTAFDSASLAFLCELGIRRIKVPSGEVTNDPFLRDCARHELPVILSTGMADLAEAKRALAVLREAGAQDVTVLHCTSSYPTEFEDVNLLAMRTLSAELGVPAGYSDHTRGIFVPPLAVALGATIVEKHITLDRSMEGPDHAASIEPDELKEMVQQIEAVETILGNGVKAPRPAEMEARRLVRRGIKAARDLKAGHVLQPGDLAVLRPASGLDPALFDATVGKRLHRDLASGDPIESDHLE